MVGLRILKFDEIILLEVGLIRRFRECKSVDFFVFDRLSKMENLCWKKLRVVDLSVIILFE